ncbi:hypothetical protein JRO89_XS03G0120800 [Xanthoceras sorbifolium]|uniref:Uncharacterized protein n=1 Tax=Xanthoceras sorbifolium TaxID=99658 RepID=A0ABQ8I9M2_9ROSI|nr:hypothetical protein JRO89_XS03G0120800 [Xanthoceras sorbifolium]
MVGRSERSSAMGRPKWDNVSHLQARIMHGSMKDTNTICKPSNTATFGSFELGAKVCFIPMVVAASS